MNKPEWIIIHHTATARDKTTFLAVDKFHRDKWQFKSSLGFYIGYHYFITADGTLNHGRADTDVGAHTIGKNENSLGICLAGNFDIETPSKAQILTLKKLLKEKTEQYHISPENIVPHRAFANKSCYGNNLADDWARSLLSNASDSASFKEELIKLLEQALEVARKI